MIYEIRINYDLWILSKTDKIYKQINPSYGMTHTLDFLKNLTWFQKWGIYISSTFFSLFNNILSIYFYDYPSHNNSV